MAEPQPTPAMTLQGDSLPEELLNIFWKSSSDWNVRAKVFGGLMFSAAGCHTLDFESLNLNDSNNLPSAEETDKVEMEPQALDPNFTARYSKFICQLFKMIPLDETGILFLRNIVKIVSQMIENPWDSVRKTGACTGLKLLTFCMKISGSANLESSDTSSDTSCSPNTSYIKKQFGSLKKNLEMAVFKKSLRDVCVSIRTLAYVEILVWAHHDPRALLDGDLPSSLQFGLHDKKENAIYALAAIEVLFKEDLHDSRQIALFIKIQGALVAHLGTPGGFAIKAMSTLSSAVSNIPELRKKIQQAPSSSDVIFFSMFNKYQAVAIDAAKYFFTVTDMDKDVSNPLVVLKKLFIFFMEARENMGQHRVSEDLLMDAFHPILKEFVTWEHWEQMLSSCETQHTVVVAKLLYCFARKATTNHCPDGRVRRGDSPKKKDLLSAANDLTTFLTRTWKTFFSMDKIHLNPEAMSVFTRVMTFFNASLPSNIAFDIIKYLTPVVKGSSNEAVLSSAWSTISRLYKRIPWDSACAMQLKSIFDSVKNFVVEEFSEILPHSSLMMGHNFDESKARLLFVIKFIEPQDNFRSLWERCAEELDSQCASANLDVPKVGMILEVLRGILIRQFDAVTASADTSFDGCSGESVDDPAPDDSQMSVSADLTSQLVSRGQYLQKRTVDFLRNNDSLKLLSFDILVEMVVCFGKHMAGHPTCMIISDTLHSEVDLQLVKAACDAIRQPNCKDETCCHMLKYVCELFSAGMIDITKMDVLLTRTGTNEDHDVMIMSALKAYAEWYPMKYKLVAAAIVSGLKGIIFEVFSSAEVTDYNENVWQAAVAKMRERYFYWESMLDFLAVLKIQKIQQTAVGLMRNIAIRADNDYLFSTTSELLLTTSQADAESATGDSEAVPESDFSLAFAERSLIPHSTPHPSAMLTDISESERSESSHSRS